MKLTGKTYGTTRAGERIDLVTATNSNGVSFSIISYGATIISVKCPDRDGKIGEITLGKADLEAYEAGHPYFGSTIGRFCNRIAEAKFNLGKTEYKLNANDGPNSLHGGSAGFDKRIWDIFPFRDDYKAGARLTYVSEDGEEGYPGRMDISVIYTLNEDNQLFWDYEAISNKAGPINMTNHIYWNLEDPENSDILDHKLQLKCSRYIPVDDSQIPLGELRETSGGPFDFQTAKRIGDDINEAGGYDHSWITDSYKKGCNGLGSEENFAAVKDSEAFAVLTSEASGRRLEFYTSQPAVQFYSGNSINNEGGRSGIYKKYSGLCLETQNFPNAPNQPDFPSSILEPGKKYVHRTIIRLSTP